MLDLSNVLGPDCPDLLFSDGHFSEKPTVVLSDDGDIDIQFEFKNAESFGDLAQDPDLISVTRFKRTFFNGYFGGKSFKWAYKCVIGGI